MTHLLCAAIGAGAVFLAPITSKIYLEKEKEIQQSKNFDVIYFPFTEGTTKYPQRRALLEAQKFSALNIPEYKDYYKVRLLDQSSKFQYVDGAIKVGKIISSASSTTGCDIKASIIQAEITDPPSIEAVLVIEVRDFDSMTCGLRPPT